MPVIEAERSWVLVVEDNGAHAELAACTLGEADTKLTTVLCENSEDAIETLWKNRASLPDAVFIDIELGGENGLNFVRRIKQSETLCGIKTVVLTVSLDDCARTEALLAGADAYVTKPLGIHRAVRFLRSGEFAWELSDLPSSLEEYRERKDDKVRRPIY